MASRYGVDASETPARNAPTSRLNPRASPAAASDTAHAMAEITSSSWDRARSRVADGSTHLINTTTNPRNTRPFTTTNAAVVGNGTPSSPVPLPTAVNAIITRMTTMSCTIRNPTAMRPCSASISRLSERSLTMMMVLENVSATAM